MRHVFLPIQPTPGVFGEYPLDQGSGIHVAACRKLCVGNDFAEFGFYFMQLAQNGIMIIFAAPGVAGNPSALWIVNVRRVRVSGVVVDGADNHASRPRESRFGRCAFEFPVFAPSLEIFHFPGTASCDPFREVVQFLMLAQWRDAGEFKSGLVRGRFDLDFEFGSRVHCKPCSFMKFEPVQIV